MAITPHTILLTGESQSLRTDQGSSDEKQKGDFLLIAAQKGSQSLRTDQGSSDHFY